ncbi:hypothetical protein N7492_007870 [Penicillium capsulatum]|uniref:Uncharacterized protein n=1 Tax=Penicillium capsulatum TaxID=69766 RepID=A0A9W9I2Y1_9EURO|nr:hypothetical protein N7492_007870 [Penicillium capsulatum]KAJ6117701.1 hypothetical protein N7512_007426 [Penicillium capsulatum]
MDHFKPSPLSASRRPSATFPLTQGSPSVLPPNGRPDESGAPQSTDRPSRRHHTPEDVSPETGLEDRRRSHRHRLDPASVDRNKSHHRHKHSKSRELRLPRPMSHLASSASARGLLSPWSGREKDREGEEGLLRPVTHETTRSRWGSDSTNGLESGSRKGSLLDTPEQHERLGPIQRQEIQSMEDLERVKQRRKQGEEYLRSALASIGSLATDVTRRLDYTYYNLLEKITALNSTIGLFQELSESAATLLTDFEQEIAGLDQEVRKQIHDLKGFEPQIQKADALEARMRAGRQRVEELGKRLETVRGDIDRWERRESDWQSRVSRRLRIFWTIVGSALLVLVLGLVLQNWPTLHPTEMVHPSRDVHPSEPPGPLSLREQADTVGSSWYPSNLEDRRQSLTQAARETSRTGPETAPTQDPFRVLDEL